MEPDIPCLAFVKMCTLDLASVLRHCGKASVHLGTSTPDEDFHMGLLSLLDCAGVKLSAELR